MFFFLCKIFMACMEFLGLTVAAVVSLPPPPLSLPHSVSLSALLSDFWGKTVIMVGILAQIFVSLQQRTSEKGGISDDLIGGNPSTEEALEGMDDETVSGVDIVLANRLTETSFAKKDYQKYIKVS